MARHKFAVGVLAALALLSSFRLLLDVLAVYSRNEEIFGVGAFEERFSALRGTLPKHSTVGYVAPDSPAGDVATNAEYNLTQYTLSPVIVNASTEEHLVVANSHNPRPNPAALQPKHLVPVQDFGGGVQLYRNATK